ncbi:MAG: adenine deaminase, partial [Actinobacteria bacterium]|nr:adenine deaminase [Actinomycetota bacterium]
LAPGYRADLIVVDDLQDFRARIVLSDGRIVAEDGDYKGARPAPPAPPGGGVQVKWEAVDLAVPVTGGAKARVIDAIPGQIVTGQSVELLKAENGQAVADPERDL